MKFREHTIPFGILKAKFRRMYYLDMILLNKIPTVILACCVLHNLILKCEGVEGEREDNFQENYFFDEHNIPQAAIHKRFYCKYFVNHYALM